MLPEPIRRAAGTISNDVSAIRHFGLNFYQNKAFIFTMLKKQSILKTLSSSTPIFDPSNQLANTRKVVQQFL
jgi:hypothetical protein